MFMLNMMRASAIATREFLSPDYRPERYYMRGPGPACAKRGGIVIVAARRLD